MVKKSQSEENPSLLRNKIIVCIGGGTGLFSLLSGLKEYALGKHNIKAIVTTLDSGGSSGVLRTQFGVLPPGDIRNCLVALSSETEILNKLFQYRFNKKINNHNFGNLLITALCDVTGSFDEAVKQASRILRIKGEVVPVSLDSNHIIAQLEDGKTLIGEKKIDTTPNKKIEKIYLKNKPKTNKRAAEVLKRADIIIFGPGDLYTSIIPNLLFPNLRNAIKKNQKAKRILISPVMTKPGETDNFPVSKFREEIEKYLKSELTHIISNNHMPKTSALKAYKKENKHPVIIDANNIKGVKLIRANLIDENQLVRHNPSKIAKAIAKLI